MSQLTVVLAALGAAGAAATAAALQFRTARAARKPAELPTGGLLRFAQNQLGSRVWWTAAGVQVVALVLHATALQGGALTLVQPLMATTVVLALPINHFLNSVPVSRRQLGWAVLLAAALTGFLLISGASSPPPNPGGNRVVVAIALGVVLIVGCVLASRHASGTRAAVLLGTASAVGFTGEAAFLQSSARTAVLAPAELVTSLATYGVVIAGITGVAFTQLAYRSGPMSAALPAIVTVNPLLSIVVGVAVQREQFRHTTWAVVAEVATFAVLCVAAFALARESPRSTDGRQE